MIRYIPHVPSNTKRFRIKSEIITTFKKLRLLFHQLNFVLVTLLFYLLFVIIITRVKIVKFWNISSPYHGNVIYYLHTSPLTLHAQQHMLKWIYLSTYLFWNLTWTGPDLYQIGRMRKEGWGQWSLIGTSFLESINASNVSQYFDSHVVNELQIHFWG